MGRRLTSSERRKRDAEKLAAHRRGQRRHAHALRKEEELQERRLDRKLERRWRKEDAEEAQEAADQEFAAWQAVEEQMRTLAAPTSELSAAEQRLRDLLAPQVFVGATFDEHPYNFEHPSGPNAGLVNEIRLSTTHQFDKEAPQIKDVFGIFFVVGILVGLGGIVALLSGSVGGLVTGALVMFATWGLGFVIDKVREIANREERASLWQGLATMASARALADYERAEGFRRAKFEAEQEELKRNFNESEAVRVARLSRVLERDQSAMQEVLDAVLLPLDDLPFECAATAKIRTAEIVDLAFIMPTRSELPSQRARRTQAGVSYAQKGEAVLVKEYRRTLPALALRHASEIMAILPSVDDVKVDAYDVRADPRDGSSFRACILSMSAKRSDLESVDLAEADPDVLVKDRLEGSYRWSKEDFLEQQPRSRVDPKEIHNLSLGDLESDEKDDVVEAPIAEPEGESLNLAALMLLTPVDVGPIEPKLRSRLEREFHHWSKLSRFLTDIGLSHEESDEKARLELKGNLEPIEHKRLFTLRQRSSRLSFRFSELDTDKQEHIRELWIAQHFQS